MVVSKVDTKFIIHKPLTRRIKVAINWSFMMLIFLWVYRMTESSAYRSNSHSITLGITLYIQKKKERP